MERNKIKRQKLIEEDTLFHTYEVCTRKYSLKNVKRNYETLGIMKVIDD